MNGFGNRDAVSAAFGLSETYDYYLERHGRDSLDGQQGTILAIVRFDQNFFNAFWNGTLMVFGDAVPFAGALDVAAHELTHGVTQFSANLVYEPIGAPNKRSLTSSARWWRGLGDAGWLKGGDLGEPCRTTPTRNRWRSFPAWDAATPRA